MGEFICTNILFLLVHRFYDFILSNSISDINFKPSGMPQESPVPSLTFGGRLPILMLKQKNGIFITSNLIVNLKI